MQMTVDGKKKWSKLDRVQTDTSNLVLQVNWAFISHSAMSFLESIQAKKGKLKPTTIRTTYPNGTQTVSSVLNGKVDEEALAATTYGFVIDTHPDTVPACIVGDFLYLGSQDAVSFSNIDTYKITDILSIGIPVPESITLSEDESHSLISTTFIECLDLPETNLQPIILKAVDIINTVRLKNRRILVHCNAGVSRSASICIAYLMMTENLQYAEAFALVKSKRECIQPNRGFVEQLKQIKWLWDIVFFNRKPKLLGMSTNNCQSQWNSLVLEDEFNIEETNNNSENNNWFRRINE